MSNVHSNLFVDDGGTGLLPVLFIHSLAGNTGQWSAQLSHLRASRRAVALDLPGHGRSAAPADGNFAIDSLAQAVHRSVEEMGLEKFVLVGHSLGGSVAVAYAGMHPKRVAGLLLVDPSGDSTQIPQEEIRPFLGALDSEAYPAVIEGYWNQILEGSTGATQEKTLQDLRSTPRETVVSALKAIFQYNPQPALQHYNGPKLSIITPLNETPFALHQLDPNLPHQVITGTGHWLQMDKPEAFNRLMDKFLAKVDDK
ncbi:MAG: alpha/beta hydrolase [Ardenticatenaceae bacterium]|nr:alpha/beta hydrolase [Ardenticatenaceae bacterium]